ncbi:MAG: hypothetical protein V1921_03060 [Candidatus Altiarchaeota archaeon]
MYFAIVTSMPELGYTDAWGRHADTGDLALDLDRNSGTGEYGYEYGIKTHGSSKGQICYLPDWSLPNSGDGFPASAPSTMSCTGSESVVKGSAETVYANAGSSDNGVSNYIIEIKVPKNLIGSPVQGDIGDLHSTVTCGNDVIEIDHYSFDFPVPEFFSVLVPLMILLTVPTILYLKVGTK